jgi:hypothetical protein
MHHSLNHQQCMTIAGLISCYAILRHGCHVIYKSNVRYKNEHSRACQVVKWLAYSVVYEQSEFGSNRRH